MSCYHAIFAPNSNKRAKTCLHIRAHIFLFCVRTLSFTLSPVRLPVRASALSISLYVSYASTRNFPLPCTHSLSHFLSHSLSLALSLACVLYSSLSTCCCPSFAPTSSLYVSVSVFFTLTHTPAVRISMPARSSQRRSKNTHCSLQATWIVRVCVRACCVCGCV